MSERHPDQPEPASGRPYVLALLGLLAFTALSFGLHFAPLGGGLGAAVALAIAGAKVAIVGLVFMELRESLAATRMVALVSVGFVALLCLGILGDVAFR
jgi:caa(3)-type oxidase subunit IV